MSVWIALLRGINVGGNRKVPMADLRSACEEAGFDDVRTLIASGNVVLTSSMRSAAKVREVLERAIEARFGFPVVVVVRTPAQLQRVVDEQPFDDVEHVNVAFLVSAPEREALTELEDALVNDAELHVVGDHAYLRAPHGLGQPTMKPAAARRFSAGATVRNWRTVTRLLEMAQQT